MFASVERKWKKGDKIELTLPVEPRLVSPNDSINTVKDKLAIAAGPVIYGFEGIDNPDMNKYTISDNTDL